MSFLGSCSDSISAVDLLQALRNKLFKDWKITQPYGGSFARLPLFTPAVVKPVIKMGGRRK
jgi:hypothetical protein